MKANNALLQTDYTDITLIHWPCKANTLDDVLAQTNACVPAPLSAHFESLPTLTLSWMAG